MSSEKTFHQLEAGRSNNFDALRLLFAYLVIFSHSYPLLNGSNDSEPLYRLTGGQRTFGELAVDGFFLVSGYLITASWQRSRGLGDYLRKRVLRIYPGFLVAVAFSSLVAAPWISDDSWDYWRRFRIAEFVKRSLDLQGAYSPDPTPINGSLWSIRYEFLCYLGLAAFGLMGLLKRRYLVLSFTIFCTALDAAMIYRGLQMPGSRLSWIWGFPGFWPRLAALYFAGSTFHLFADRIIHSGRIAALCLIGLMAAAFIPGSKALPLLIPSLGGYLLFFCAFTPIRGLKDISRRGDFSYGLYLYAFPIQVCLVHSFRRHLSAEGLAILASLLTTVFAAMSWHFVEKRFLSWKHRPSSGSHDSPGPPESGSIPPPTVSDAGTR